LTNPGDTVATTYLRDLDAGLECPAARVLPPHRRLVPAESTLRRIPYPSPNCRVSVHVLWGKQRQNTVIAVGKSILNRTSGADVGALMLSYGGGGHANAGTCQVPHADADRVVEQLVGHLNASAAAPV
jgi:nanoRNase/pAp phosphatase (c-di-AMP/oligoRNAs hydrolase)